MNEPTDPAAEPDSRPPVIAEEASGLSPVQRARQRYDRHVTDECARCRDIDRDRCTVGQQLWRDWEDACDEAYRRLAERTT